MTIPNTVVETLNMMDERGKLSIDTVHEAMDSLNFFNMYSDKLYNEMLVHMYLVITPSELASKLIGTSVAALNIDNSMILYTCILVYTMLDIDKDTVTWKDQKSLTEKEKKTAFGSMVTIGITHKNKN